MKLIILLSLLFISALGCFSQQSIKEQIIESENIYWINYDTVDGIKIDYKFETCSRNNNERWLVLRFTNLSLETKSITWNPIWYRDNDCVNCRNVEGREFNFTLTLDPKETVSGESCTADSRLFLFSSFIEKHPGMDDKKLTSFQFINLIIKNI